MLAQPSLPGAGQILLGILVAVAAGFDIRYRRIPNWLVLTGIVVGITWNVLSSPFWSGLGRSAAGLGLGFGLYFPLYLLRARGAGDVKLLAAAGSITGPGNCVWIFLLTAIMGGLIALILLLFKGRLQKTMFNVSWILRDLVQLRAPYRSSEELDVTTSKGMRLPHGAMIAVGSLAFIFMAQYGLNI
jgi:prepilin peptidase CpaA